MSQPVATAQVNVDEHNNVGIAVYDQSGNIRSAPLMTAALNVDENGNIGVFMEGGNSGSSGSACDAISTETINELLQETGFPVLTTP